MTHLLNSKHLFVIISILLLSVLSVHAQTLDSLRHVAEQGDAEAQFNLGIKYANGEGVPQNGTEAVKWYRLAAERGLAGTQYNKDFPHHYPHNLYDLMPIMELVIHSTNCLNMRKRFLLSEDKDWLLDHCPEV